eukprot:TRINITY_DN19547_c0_g1_i1.p1 TRINITY_DN19547_c0_g1~~TRINITY_DN19547_c0_g1_i1.p1  ORF type:complete len:290 (-),score=57.90 TRINITY_DN19547_c0_g1_i1:60-929(-)
MRRTKRTSIYFPFSELPKPMVVPEEQEGKQEIEETINQQLKENFKSIDHRTERQGGGGGGIVLCETKKQILVDIREFRSKLPSLLHSSGMEIIPITLTIGDYLLSPHICVERKSLSDLFQSFASGRLYTQIENMTRSYQVSILLIEFDENQPFCLQENIPQTIQPYHISSKLVLLTRSFPTLRIIWSHSPRETTIIFKDLKEGQPEPLDNEEAEQAAESEREMDSIFDPVDVLKKLPGITESNCNKVMESVENLSELSQMGVLDLQKLLGKQNGQKLWQFFNSSIFSGQ